ncbi:MAG TPA: VanW family protein [Tissierellales bacterium]|nr:VanW family protein [Tissierellales bacterium]
MEKTGKKSRKILYLVLVVIAILFGVAYYSIYSVLNVETIYEGIKVEEFDLSNKTKEDAIKLIESKREEELEGKEMKLNYRDKVYSIGLKDLGFKYDYSKAVDEAYNIGRQGTFINKLKIISNTKKEGKTFKLESSYDKKLIDKHVEEIKKDINLKSKNAVFNFNGGNFQVTEEVLGREVDEKTLKTAIEDNIYILKDIEIPVNIIEPKVKKELLGRVNGVIGEFSTSLGNSSKDRKENIRISSKSVSGKLLLPNETVSFNELTGPRNVKNGYKEASIIVKGEFIPGLGGGVCQTSTTLYNALLLANMTIVERGHHSIPVKYVDLGHDATVSYGHIDLRFKNDFDFPVYITMEVSNNKVYARVYGDKNSKDYQVKITSEVVEKVKPKTEKIKDNSLKPGAKEVVQQGREGYKVNTYKQIIKNGKIVETKQITSDYYKPSNYIYKVGP